MREECCPVFNPEPWEDKTLTFENRLFIKDRVISFFHIPINFGRVMKRNIGVIEAANAAANPPVILSDEFSLWGADVYIEVTQTIPNVRMATISGTFLSKVFEGPYKNIRYWMAEMKDFVASKGANSDKLYFYYTTCPKCAKKHGRNYVVLLARIVAGQR